MSADGLRIFCQVSPMKKITAKIFKQQLWPATDMLQPFVGPFSDSFLVRHLSCNEQFWIYALLLEKAKLKERE